ncbi:MAG TPA: SRPBCC domain-containing protein [Rhizomicrobium sp.]|nr:SRPBCC domain-containing protein [Rhizomicrobium sp.]
MSGKVTVRVTHRFAARPERVFDAWLDPKTAAKWLFATATGTITRCEIDPRVGGKFSIVRLEGIDIEHVGEYLEIDRPRRLVFTFGVPKFSPEMTRVIVEIVASGEGCELTLTNEGVPADYGERNREGWTMILGNLEKSIA